MLDEMQHRKALTQARRIVIKVGTRVLVGPSGRPSPKRLETLVREVARLHKQGKEVVLVSSGAVGAGLQALGRKKRPTALPDLQMAAAVGQSRLMTLYDQLFRKRGCTIGQVLLTHDDLKHRARHLNARNTMMNLLRHDCIPIVNENDVVSVDEIKVGDNDTLASLVSILVDADLLILLTTVNGVQSFKGNQRGTRIGCLDRISKDLEADLCGKGHDLSTGGMASKLEAALQVSRVGGRAVIADGRKAETLQSILRGDDEGTLVVPRQQSKTPKNLKKRWLAFFQRPQGAVRVDRGAEQALLNRGKSLLPIGVKAVEGPFEKGACVEIQSMQGTVIGYGLSDFSSEALEKIKGHPSTDIADLLGSKDYNEVIHRDNLVITATGQENQHD